MANKPGWMTTFPLEEGVFAMTWPPEISEQSFRYIEALTQIVLNRLACSVGVEYSHQSSIKAKHPPHGRVIGPGDTRTGEVAEDCTSQADGLQGVDALAPGG